MDEKLIKVSVVVPVYKVEKYLERCIQSLVRQTLNQMEIILVDDGSPDRCPEMCDEFAKKYKQIKVIHKKNGGLSSARNAGLLAATGKYVGFVDSDDDVELNMYEKMFCTAEEQKVDFVMSDYVRIKSDGTKFVKTLNIREGRYNKEDIKKDIYPQLIMAENVDYGPLLSVWHCLYRIDKLKELHLLFDEEVRWSEDNIFSSILGYEADSFYYLKNQGLYHYYENPGTITTSYRKGAWSVYCTMNEHLKEYFKNKENYDFSRQLKLHLIYYACVCVNQAAVLDKEKGVAEIKDILSSKILENVFSDFKFPNVSIKLKIQLMFMKFKMATVLYKVCKR